MIATNTADEAEFYKEEVGKLKLIINELTKDNEKLQKENSREVVLGEDASELDKLHAALKTKQRQIDNVQQKLKQAGNENLQLSD